MTCSQRNRTFTLDGVKCRGSSCKSVPDWICWRREQLWHQPRDLPLRFPPTLSLHKTTFSTVVRMAFHTTKMPEVILMSLSFQSVSILPMKSQEVLNSDCLNAATDQTPMCFHEFSKQFRSDGSHNRV